MQLRCATFNVLADAYTGRDDYSYVDSKLLETGARTPRILDLIDDLAVDVIGLQETELPLLGTLEDTGRWQTFWSPKALSKPDGCLTLVRQGIEVSDFKTHYYSDRSGHVMQTVRIGHAIFANTHIKWSPNGAPKHAGVTQMTELLEQLGPDQPAVILANCNDRPGGPVRELVENAGFINTSGDLPTAFVKHRPVAIDLLAVRGLSANYIETNCQPINIPDDYCPSDHIPIVASVEVSH